LKVDQKDVNAFVLQITYLWNIVMGLLGKVLVTGGAIGGGFCEKL